MPDDTKISEEVSQKEPEIIPQQESEDMAQILKKKIMKYTLLGDYEGFKQKELTFRRWPFGACIELVPISIEVAGNIAQYFVPEMGQGSSVSILDRLGAPSVARELTKQGNNIKLLVLRSIMLEAEANGFKGTDPEVSMKFVEQLELADMIGIVKLLYVQNLEHAIKNVFGPVFVTTSAFAKKSA